MNVPFLKLFPGRISERCRLAYKRTRDLVQLFFGKVPDNQVHRAYRFRVALFFVLVVTIVAALLLIYQLTQTLDRLYLAEGERDRDPNDPHLPKGSVDAVLIANSYHEFTNPLAILDHTFRALRSDGRLVVLDRGPRSYHEESREIQMQQYQIAASVAEGEIRQRGFEVLSRDNRFIDRPAVERPGDRQDDHVWWLIVARKP